MFTNGLDEIEMCLCARSIRRVKRQKERQRDRCTYTNTAHSRTHAENLSAARMVWNQRRLIKWIQTISSRNCTYCMFHWSFIVVIMSIRIGRDHSARKNPNNNNPMFTTNNNNKCCWWENTSLLSNIAVEQTKIKVWHIYIDQISAWKTRTETKLTKSLIKQRTKTS